MELETNRLILREVEKEDVNELAENINNINIAKWVVSIPHPYSKEDAQWWINKQLKEQKEKPRTAYHFRIVPREINKAIGTVGIFGFDENKVKGELGYWLAQPHWKKGYMKEAVKEVIRYSFEDLGLNKILIPCFSENPGSNALAKSLGFRLEGKFKKHAHCLATGKIHDENVYGLLKTDWRKSK